MRDALSDGSPGLPSSRLAALTVLDEETVRLVYERTRHEVVRATAAAWLQAYATARQLGFAESTARRQAAAAWDGVVRAPVLVYPGAAAGGGQPWA